MIHMLEAFVNLTFSDQGIEPLLESEIVEQFGKILDGGKIESELGEYYPAIACLSLRVLGNMSINEFGK